MGVGQRVLAQLGERIDADQAGAVIVEIEPALAQRRIIERFRHGREIGEAAGQVVVGGGGHERVARHRMALLIKHVRLNPFSWGGTVPES